MPSEEQLIRDLAYFDREKASSLYSQISGGLPIQVEKGAERTDETRATANVSLPRVGGSIEGGETYTVSEFERREIHHHLLVRLEDELFDQPYAVDLNRHYDDATPTSDEIRQFTEGVYYIRATGWSSIEDYERIRYTAGQFNTVVDFYRQSAEHQIDQLEEQLEARLDEFEGTIDRNERARMIHQVREQIEEQRDNLEDLEGLPEWLVEGVRDWIETFAEDRIIFRLFPFEYLPEFQLLANLKRECFVGTNMDNLLFAYGQQPNVPLTLMGLVTSRPPEGEPDFDTLAVYGDEEEGEDVEEFEKAFREVFDAVANMEEFARYSTYPRLTLYPVAIYRNVGVQPTEPELEEKHRAPPWWRFGHEQNL